MKYYIIENDYVGPNRAGHELTTPAYTIQTTPGRTNMSHEERINGWLGTTNDWHVAAHGEYSDAAGVIEFFRRLGLTDAEADHLVAALETKPEQDWPRFVAARWAGGEVAKVNYSAGYGPLCQLRYEGDGEYYDLVRVWDSMVVDERADLLAHYDYNEASWELPDELIETEAIREIVLDNANEWDDDDFEPDWSTPDEDKLSDLAGVLNGLGWQAEALTSDQLETGELYAIPPLNLITQAEAGRRAGISTQAINQAIRDGRLTGYKNANAAAKRQGATLVDEAQVREVWGK